jgi:hypothetical protein
MTPLRTKQAITSQVGTKLDGHIADINNPHSVTKAQVGLGIVENYRVATQAESQAGTLSTRYMTPQGTRQAITSQVGNSLANHIGDTNNPHNVTKAQVGLSIVENYRVASQYEAIAGSLNTRYMTPLRSSEQITDRLLNLNASQLTSGRVPDARLTGNYSGINDLTANRFLGNPNDHAGAPSHSWSGDSNTGMYRDGAGQIAFAINGAKRFYITASEVWAPGDVVGFSDERLKENFDVFDDALSRVHQLNGGLYNRIDLEGKRQCGVMAQNMLAVVPELVSKSTTGIYGVSYGNFTALLLEAIKEVDNKYTQQIDALNNRINLLEG